MGLCVNKKYAPDVTHTIFQTVSLETVWKSERGRSMTYAPEYEKELLHRSHRRRMGVSGAPCSTSQQARTTENPQSTPRDPQRHLLPPQERVRLAVFASRL